MELLIVYDCIANANSDILLLYNVLNNNLFKNNPFTKNEVKFFLEVCKQIKEGDYYYITVVPTLLGGGIRLFENANQEIQLRLLKTQSYNGMTDLIYTRR